MRITVTGATGNVGTALLRRLADEPDIEVTGIARRVPGPGAGWPYNRVRWHAVDLGEPTAVAQLTDWLTGMDAVVHLAWQLQPSHRRAQLRRTNLGGTRHVLTAMREAGVPKLVYASSVGTYSPGPKDEPVTEEWPNSGILRSGYSVDKAAVETLLDGVEREQPELRVVRLRKALVFQRDAGPEIARYFLGPLTRVAVRPSGRVTVLPRSRQLRTQVVHAEDVAEAYLRALRGDQTGAFNIATWPPVDGQLVTRKLGGLAVPAPLGMLRLAARLAWRARLVPAAAGWLDLAASAPLMDCSRAEREWGWRPRYDALETVRDLLYGIATGSGTESAPLSPRRQLPRHPVKALRARRVFG